MILPRRVYLLGCLLLPLIQAEATVLLSEEFDYPDGSLISVSGGIWSNHSGTVGQLQVQAGKVVLEESSSSGEDVNVLLTGQPYPSTADLTLYIGFTVRFTSLPGSGEQYFLHFKNSGTGFRGKVFATTDGATSGSFRLGITEGASSGAAYLPEDLEMLEDYRIVVRYHVGTAASTLWIDPAAESDPSTTATDTGIAQDIIALALRQSAGIGDIAIDDVIVATGFGEVVTGSPQPPAPTVPAFSLLNYNTHGNHVEDWSTNSPQVRAIGRQVEHLDPDIITFQEIPLTNTWQMTNFVLAFRPGFHLASNSGTDGYIRSVILSRYPIRRSQKWLDGISLVPFGYEGNFTRDLFEAEIAVPGFPEPVHVFTVHLKSGQGSADSARRAAEACAISNYFVAGFLPGKGSHPYVLTGDMNEDIARPPSSNPQSLQTLTSPSTGLRLTTPRNAYNRSELTLSIQSGMYARYDYILPGGLLFSNIVSSQVFRSDLVPAPRPPPLLSTDCAIASDHLPVMMFFSNPFDQPFHLLSVTVSNGLAALTWESTPGRAYDVEASSDLEAWDWAATNLAAVDTNLTHVLSATNPAQFFRVVRRPP